MRGILQIYKSFFGKLTVFLVVSFFVPVCHTREEPVSVQQVTVKKETASYNQSKEIQADAIVKTRKKKPETPVNHSASGILLPENQEDKNRFCDPATDSRNPDTTSLRDPFALPEALRKLQPVARGKQSLTSEMSHPEAPLQQTIAPPGSQEPCVTGIFDSGKEKLALLHWQQVQGTFRCGEPLGNGYYVQEITASTVLLYPENNNAGIKPVTLTLQQ